MSIEQKINYQLNKYPAVKKIIKRIYQLGMYAISPKIKSEGNIVKVSPNDEMEYFFGYYDKSPWDRTSRYMLCMRAKDTWTYPDPAEPCELIMIDTQNSNKIKHLAYTHAWNVQQGCMAQWLAEGKDDCVIYNDFNGGGYYCSYILNVKTGEKRELPKPIYSVSSNGEVALSLDFLRLHRLRKGYGYSLIEEETAKEKLPDKTCIWKIDIRTGEVKELLKYTDFAKFEPRPEMKNTKHKVNHIMLNPSGNRFMVLHRWFDGYRKYSRLLTCNIDGSDMYNLSDDDMVSHCYWKDDDTIIAFENKHGRGPGYYLMKDRTKEYTHLWPTISNDGHPSYCPTDHSLIITDSYPNRARIADLKLLRDTDMQGEDEQVIARVFAPFKYDNDTRCDLHPRWRKDGKAVCFDSVFEGHRGLYIVNLENE